MTRTPGAVAEVVSRNVWVGTSPGTLVQRWSAGFSLHHPLPVRAKREPGAVGGAIHECRVA